MATTDRLEAAYELGYDIGVIRAGDPTYDVRFDMADAAREGKAYFAEFKAGLEAAMREKREEA